MVDKLIRDGKVAVIISPGYGAGWSTWASGPKEEQILYDPDIALAILGESDETREEVAARKYNLEEGDYVCTLGLDQAEVEWVPVGTPFRVDEYDGHESLMTGTALTHTA